MVGARLFAAAATVAAGLSLFGCVMTEGHTKADVMNSEKTLVTVESSTKETEPAIRNMRLQKWPEAAADLENAVKVNPNDDKAWFALGLCYENMGQYEKAEDAYAKANALVGGAGESNYIAGYMRMKEKTGKN